jgi:hypothetical protein
MCEFVRGELECPIMYKLGFGTGIRFHNSKLTWHIESLNNRGKFKAHAGPQTEAFETSIPDPSTQLLGRIHYNSGLGNSRPE